MMKASWWLAGCVALIVVAPASSAIWAAADEGPREEGSSAEATSSNTPEPTPTPEESAEEPLVNTLKWTTASEVDNFGFDIYRGLAEDGPFDRITDEPLPGAGTTDEPQSYVFVDEEIDPTRDYFYYIESISLGGVRETFSPVIRAPAKRPSETSRD